MAQGLLRDPDSAEGHNNLGLVRQSLGRLEEAAASFRHAVSIRPSYRLALTNLGVALAALGQHEEALACHDAALELEPADVAALHNAGAALLELGRWEEAIHRFQAVLTLAPDLADAHRGLAVALRERGRFAEAIASYRSVLGLRQTDAEVHLELGLLLQKIDNQDEALAHFEQACALDPGSARALAGLGRLQQEMGRIEAAQAVFRRAVAAAPGDFLHYLNLAGSTTLTVDDPDFQAMLNLAGRIGALDEADQVNAHFALGKALADVGRHEEAFAHVLAGNVVRRRKVDYDERQVLTGLQRIKDTFTAERLALWPTGSSSEAPVFIVGMPRSGSTLVEQILAAHPDAACTGESFALRDAAKGQGIDVAGRLFPAPGFLPTEEQMRRAAQAYLELTTGAARPAARARSAARLTDKMLANFRHIGLITRLFPRARIIHTFRDPVESCLSSFGINFENQPFTFDMGELGRYYHAYAVLMRHWRRTLPAGAIFDVRYEAVAQDFEASARAIIAHCGLEWHDDCLRFHEAERPVKTASVEQVRRPIYRSAVRKWRPDEQTLRPLLEGLGLKPSGPTA